MIEYKKGNIFDGDENIICHQTNCLGIMGGGIALQVKNLYPEVYKEYSELCNEYKEQNNITSLLGYTQFVETNDGKYIANCFGQFQVGFGTRQTEYMALQSCLEQVYKKASQEGLSVAIPYKIGCGLAGGNWSVVEDMIKKIFDKSSVICVIYEYVG